MTARILPLFAFSRPKMVDWSQQELSEFYRVESALVQAGMRVETDRGVSDEGDPWFVFCREEDGEVIVHFARLDSRYIVSSPSYTGISTGDDFGQLVKDLMSRHPLVHSGKRSTTNVFLHPTALLVALVATAFFKSGQANAHDNDELELGQQQRSTSASLPQLSGSYPVTVALEASHVAIVISAAIFAMTSARPVESSDSDPTLNLVVSSEAGSDDLSMNDSKMRNDSKILRTSVDQERSGPADFDILHAREMQHNDVLKLLSVVAVLSDLVSAELVHFDLALLEPFELSGSHDKVIFDSFEHSSNVQTSSSSTQGSGEPRPVVILELVKSLGEFPSIQSLETASGERVQSFEIVLVLPQILQPFLAQSVHLTSSQTSEGVMLALNILPPDLIEEPDGGEIPASSTPAHTSVAPQADLPSVLSFQADNPSAQLLGQDVKALVVDLIENFINHTPDYRVLMVAGDVIFYDEHAINVGDRSLRTITWDFADGISISLVAPSSSFSPEFFNI